MVLHAPPCVTRVLMRGRKGGGVVSYKATSFIRWGCSSAGWQAVPKREAWGPGP